MRLMSDTELRINWRLSWIASLYEFANPKLQYMSWVEGPSANWPKDLVWCSSPTECFCGYFDDLALGDRDGGYAKTIQEGLVSEEEASLVATFNSLAKKYNGPVDDPIKVLNDQNWKIVTREASLAWNQLRKIILEPIEIKKMEELERAFGAFE